MGTQWNPQQSLPFSRGYYVSYTLCVSLLWRICCFLCSVPESKVSIIKVIRSILRENVRRNMRSEGTLERGCKDRLAPLRSTLPSSARLGDCPEEFQWKITLMEEIFLSATDLWTTADICFRQKHVHTGHGVVFILRGHVTLKIINCVMF